MATKKDDAAVKARVLVDGSYGKVDEVVEIAADQIDAAVKAGEVDPHPDAVAYAESLKV